MVNKINPTFLVIDLFCGAGGVTEGYDSSGVCYTIVAINHNHKAIVSHSYNHPDAHHFEEDIKKVKLQEVAAIVDKYRRMYPSAKVLLHASLECTNFAKVKGGLPKEADSRTLANHLIPYITVLQPDYITIENVVEFMDWGPMRGVIKKVNKNEHGFEYWDLSIIKNKKKELCYGYEPIPELKGVDYDRWRKEICALGFEEDWQEINAADLGAFTSRNRLFGIFAKHGLPIRWPQLTHSKKPTAGKKNWEPARPHIDLTNEGNSVFDRFKKDGSPDPLAPNTFERLVKGTKMFGNRGEDRFVKRYHIHGQVASIDNPIPAIACKDQIYIVKLNYINRDFTSGGYAQSIDNPIGSIMPSPKLNLVTIDKLNNINTSDIPCEIRPFEIQYGDSGEVKKVYYLYNPAWGGQFHSLDKPCPVIVARQDKAPLSIIISEYGDVAIRIDEYDTENMKELKKLMVQYRISDIKMRPLTVQELLRLQGFPAKCMLFGGSVDAKMFIGNSVPPIIPNKMALALHDGLMEFKLMAA